MPAPAVVKGQCVRIGFIGLGSMGQPMARRLRRARHYLLVYNRTRLRAEPLAPESGQRFMAALTKVTATGQALKDTGAPPAAAPQQAPPASGLKTYPMEDNKPGKEPGG